MSFRRRGKGGTMGRYDDWVYDRGLEDEDWVHDRWGDDDDWDELPADNEDNNKQTKKEKA